MDRNTRTKILTEGRGAEFRNLVRQMTNDVRDLPTKSQLREELARLYPGLTDEQRTAMGGKLVEIARANAAGMDRLELVGIADSYVVAVESTLVDEDRLLPAEDTEPVDVASVLEHVDGFNPGERAIRAIDAAARAGEIETAKRLAGS